MLTNWRDQADLIIWSVWNSPVLTVITRRILGKVSVMANKGCHGTYGFDTGDEIIVVKYSVVFLQTWVSKGKVGRV